MALAIALSVGCRDMPPLIGKSMRSSEFPSTPASEFSNVTPGAWLTNFDQATEQARSENKMIIVDFTGSDWCSWCTKLREEVFDQQAFLNWAAGKAVLLELDYPRNAQQPAELAAQNERLAAKYRDHIQGYPTVLFLDPSGNVVAKMGYQRGGPSAWIASAQLQLDANAQTAFR